MMRLHWFSKAGLLEPSEFGNIPFMSLRMLEQGHFVSLEDTVLALMIELMPTLEVLVADLGWFGEKVIKALCDKENQAWANSVNDSSVQVCHLQVITLTDQKDQPRPSKRMSAATAGRQHHLETCRPTVVKLKTSPSCYL